SESLRIGPPCTQVLPQRILESIEGFPVSGARFRAQDEKLGIPVIEGFSSLHKEGMPRVGEVAQPNGLREAHASLVTPHFGLQNKCNSLEGEIFNVNHDVSPKNHNRFLRRQMGSTPRFFNPYTKGGLSPLH